MKADPALSVDGHIAEAAKQHAAGAAPEESIGFVIGGEYRSQKNVARNPREAARADADAVLGAQRNGLQAVIHSHPPPHPPCPSLADMRAQLAMGVPWAIVPVCQDGEPGSLVWWGPGVPTPPLLGRTYRHGVTDGYAIVRDWYGQNGIRLTDVARGWRWWAQEKNNLELYERGFRNAGFEEVDRDDADVGDALLIQLDAGQINHCAVLVEPGVILHHPGGNRPYDPSRLSRRDVALRWMRHVRHVIRYRRHG